MIEKSLSSVSVLVVDYDDDTADSTAELLVLHGCSVRIARSGTEALVAASAEVPDVVLMDIGMPGMDGWEAAQRLRRLMNGKQPIIIALTGYGSDDDRWRSADAGVDMHLVKPVDPNVLTALLSWVGHVLNGDGPVTPTERFGPLDREYAHVRAVVSHGR